MENRYWYFKKIYKGYCVVFVVKGKYKTSGIDKWMIKYVKKNLVSYVVIDSKFNVKVVDVKNNRYRELLLKEFFYHRFNGIKKENMKSLNNRF